MPEGPVEDRVALATGAGSGSEGRFGRINTEEGKQMLSQVYMI